MRRAASTVWAVLIFAAVGAGSARGGVLCVGDCNSDGMVLVNELIIGVNIALGLAPLSQCEAFDANGDGNVGINELILGVNNALNGCGEPPQGQERVFTILPGTGFLDPTLTRSGLFTSALGGANGADMLDPGPLTIVMGMPDASGIAPLRLKEDVILSIVPADFTCLCMHLLAAESEGSIDCDGGTAYDTRAVRAANASGFEWTVTTDLGDPSGPGNANLLIPALFERVGVTCAEVDCATFNYTNPPNVFAFTTTNAMAIQETSTQPQRLTVGGAPFNCATFSTPGGAMLAAPAPTEIPPVGNVANVFRFAEAAQ